jgi:hypothetical protein
VTVRETTPRSRELTVEACFRGVGGDFLVRFTSVVGLLLSFRVSGNCVSGRGWR